ILQERTLRLGSLTFIKTDRVHLILIFLSCSLVPSNRARVYNHFSNVTFDVSNIEKFITEARSAIVKMEDLSSKNEKNLKSAVSPPFHLFIPQFLSSIPDHHLTWYLIDNLLSI
ncbi:hypothetical protein VP01_2661g1, partial [Puccinia sorghi]